MNNPSNLNKLYTLPPIGLADRDIVYAEIDTWLKRVRETPRKVMKYKEANWDKIKKDLENTLTTINNIYEKSDTNILWNTFKNDIINSIESNIPHKLFTYKQRLPWINNNVRKLINKKNKYHRKKNQNPSMYKKTETYAKLTGNILRTSYLTYPLKTPINISTRIINQKSFLATSKALERTTRA